MSNFELRHGEAVAIGVAVDTVYSSLVHGLPADDADRVLLVLQRLGLLCDHSTLRQTDELFNGLEEFRQHLGGQLTITMLDAWCRKGIEPPLDTRTSGILITRDNFEAVLKEQGIAR